MPTPQYSSMQRLVHRDLWAAPNVKAVNGVIGQPYFVSCLYDTVNSRKHHIAVYPWLNVVTIDGVRYSKDDWDMHFRKYQVPEAVHYLTTIFATSSRWGCQAPKDDVKHSTFIPKELMVL